MTFRSPPDLLIKTTTALVPQWTGYAEITSEKTLKWKIKGAVLIQDPVNAGNWVPDGNGNDTYVADAGGKIKTWTNLDDAVRAISRAQPSLETITLQVDVEKLQPKDAANVNITPRTILERKIAALQKRVQPQTSRVQEATTKLAAIAAYQTGTPAQRGVYAEHQDQVNAATALQTWISQRVVALQSQLAALP
jgi:hypothetical protein